MKRERKMQLFTLAPFWSLLSFLTKKGAGGARYFLLDPDLLFFPQGTYIALFD